MSSLFKLSCLLIVAQQIKCLTTSFLSCCQVLLYTAGWCFCRRFLQGNGNICVPGFLTIYEQRACAIQSYGDQQSYKTIHTVANAESVIIQTTGFKETLQTSNKHSKLNRAWIVYVVIKKASLCFECFTEYHIKLNYIVQR